jgi:hypothetical protein
VNQSLYSAPREQAEACSSTQKRAPLSQGILQRKCSCSGSAGASGKCEECEKDKNHPLQRTATGTAAPATAPPIVHETIQSAGRPLDRETGARMESAFGHNFASVRIHTGAKAAESARAVSALAYTVGDSVVFGAGQYAPHTPRARRLLAHELAHVVQQRKGAVERASEQQLETEGELRERAG